MPRTLRRLGVPETESKRHIAWDTGIAGLCRVVADALDATLVQQNYSRLVIDCNRRPGSETSRCTVSDAACITLRLKSARTLSPTTRASVHGARCSHACLRRRIGN